jgi:hypothetical protein
MAETDPGYNQPGGAGFQANLARIMREQAEREAAASNQPGGTAFQENLARIMAEEEARNAAVEVTPPVTPPVTTPPAIPDPSIDPGYNEPGGEGFQENLGNILGEYNFDLYDYYARNQQSPGAKEYMAAYNPQFTAEWESGRRGQGETPEVNPDPSADPGYNQPGGAGFQENLARIMREEEARKAANQPGGEGFQENLGDIMDQAGWYDRQEITGDMTNPELYDAQFSNLVGQQNAFQNQQQQAQAIRGAQAAQEEADPFQFDASTAFDWYNTQPDGSTGLKTAVAAGAPSGDDPAATASQYQFETGVTPGMTNREAFGVVRDQISAENQKMLHAGFNDPFDPSGGDAVQFASGRNMDPNYYHSNSSPSTGPEYAGALTEFVNTLYNRADVTTPAGGGPTAAPGYALPI